MAGDAANTDPDELLVDFFERAESEGAEAALEDLCQSHPERAKELRARVGALAAAGLLPGGEPVSGGPCLPERLGGFVLGERLGSGGMGVVFRALDERLGREVALKLVRPEQLFFDGARERFRREVESIARLQHPGIVPVYSVGEEGGLPFFAMEYVRGRTLAEVVRALAGRDPARLEGADLAACLGGGVEPAPELSSRLFEGSWERACLAIVREVAEALEHAHRRSILHRDVKPSNVMLTSSGRVQLVDFGLAGSRGVSSLTRTGSQLGSLPYLAPEGFSGGARALDVRSDVYSLGVTLYELLTLRLPYPSDSESELRAAVAAGAPPAPRRFHGRLSWEAETVCLKAMDPDPRRRYATAAELAADLSNVLEGRPIVARRSGPLRRAWRWTQRHPALAVGLVTLVTVPSAFAWQQYRANEQYRLERERARAHLADALDAVDRMLTRVGDERLRNVPLLGELRLELLEDAVSFYERLSEREADGVDLRRQLARARTRVGSLSAVLGRGDASAEELRRALALLDVLRREDPGDVGLAMDEAHTCAVLAYGLRQKDQRDEAREVAARGVEVVRGLLRARPDDPAAALLLARLVGPIVEDHRNAGRPAEGLALADEALVGAERVLDGFEQGPEGDDGRYRDARRKVADLLYERTLCADQVGERDGVEDDLRRAYALAGDMVDEDPQDRALQYQQARIGMRYGAELMGTGKLDEAIAFFGAEVDEAARRAEDYPDEFRQREALCVSYNWLAMAYHRERGPDEPEDARRARLEHASSAFRSLLEATARARRDFPEVPRARFFHALAASNLAEVEHELGRGADAEPLLVEAYDGQLELIGNYPESREYRSGLLAASIGLARLRLELGALDGAEEPLRALMAHAPDDGRSALEAARLMTALSTAHAERGDEGRAEACAATAVRNLGAALAAGMATGDVEEDRDFDALRERADYRALLAPVTGTSR